MNASNDFAQLEERLSRQDHTTFLGRLVWYYVSDVHVSERDFGRILNEEGLGILAPPPPLDVDVFKRACSSAQRKAMPTSDPNVVDNYLVRRIGKVRDNNLCARVVRERVDANTNQLLFESELCLLTWDRDTKSLTVTCEADDLVAKQIAHDIVAAFDAGRGMVTGSTVRNVIRDALVNTANATNVRGPNGGVYFVSEANAAIVEALERVAAKVPGSVVVHPLPLIDDSKQREMLRQAYESETAEEIDRWMSEVAELLGGTTKVTDDQLEHYVERLNRARGKVKEYSTLLEDGLGEAASRIKIFQLQVQSLVDKSVIEGTRRKRGQS